MLIHTFSPPFTIIHEVIDHPSNAENRIVYVSPPIFVLHQKSKAAIITYVRMHGAWKRF